jgi:hypothetical protein
MMMYNTDSGEVTQRKNYISMNEDIFFPMRDGKKSSVEHFNGNTAFNTQLDDLKLTMQMLYDALQLPDTRWGAEAEGMYTNKHDMALKEMNFAKMCGRLQNRFKPHIEDFFMTHLRLRNYDKHFLTRSNYKIRLNRNNQFERFKQLEADMSRFDLLNSGANFIISGENYTTNPAFSREFFFKKIMGFSDADLAVNKELLEKELKEFQTIMKDAADMDSGGAPPI